MFTKSTLLMLCVCFWLYLGCGEVKASLIAIDDLTYGAPWAGSASVVRDTDSGLEWLNPYTAYNYYSYYDAYNGLMANLSPGGGLAGWKLASVAQVLTLMFNSGLHFSIYPHTDTTEQYSPAMTNFQSLFGCIWTGADNPYYYTIGVVSDSPGPGQVSSIGIASELIWTLVDGEVWGDPNAFWYHKQISYFYGAQPMTIDNFNNLNYGNRPIGAWLVRDADYPPVPEPSTFLLVSCGLLGLTWAHLRRKNR